jgi:AcrR family transcriptional regulator
MSAPDRTSSQRTALLQSALDHVLAHGLGDLSLRSVATEIGTSHRMLIYHFGSADGFWEAVLDAFRHREQSLMQSMADESDDARKLLLQAWERYSSHENLAIMRLVFEIYGRALRTPEKYQLFLDDVVNSWLSIAETWLRAVTTENNTSVQARARLVVATVRGLLLDLLTTNDRPGTEAALQLFIQLITDHSLP